MKESLEILQSFHKCSGLKINLGKTKAVWLGNTKAKPRLIEEKSMQWINNFDLLGILFDMDPNAMVIKNYERKIHEIGKVVNHFKRFKLSIIGKVNVLKTMALPKLVYLFSVLPNPSIQIMDKIKSIFKEFLGEGGQTNINDKQLEKNIEDGGLKLINLNAFNKSVKMTWIKRLLTTSGSWQYLFEEHICKQKKIIWELDNKALHRLKLGIKNLFWKNVIESWEHYKLTMPDDVDPRTLPIQVLVNDNPVNMDNVVKILQDCGVLYINDLIMENSGFYGYMDFKQKYKLHINFLDFYSLMHSIPRQWDLSKSAKLKPSKVKQNILEKVIVAAKVCKFVYQNLIKQVKINRGHETKWELVLDVEIEEHQWKKIYSINFESCIESSLRAFQYNILLRTLSTNRHLARCNLVNTDKCFFCQIHIETIEHLFWSCVVIRNFVFTIMDKINVPGEIKKEIGAVEFLLGYTSSSTYKNLNFLFTLIKKFVFMKKSSGSQLCVNRF